MAWVLTVCAPLRLSQAKTLADWVGAALFVGRVSLPAIGRQLLGPTAAKHRIKRTWRFVANRRVEISTAMPGVVRRLVKRRRKPLWIGLDWTERRGFCPRMAAAVLKSRAAPLVWASYPKGVLYQRQNNLEEGLLRVLRTMIPEKGPVILLADRGFGRTALARTCQFLGFHDVVRIRPDVWSEHPDFRGKLLDYPVRRGMCRWLADVQYRQQRPVAQHVGVRWKVGRPPQRDEPWFLMTDLRRAPLALSELYARRMTVEERFRDDQNRWNGYALRATPLTRADRIDRRRLILALAYILWVGLGLVARRHYRPGAGCSSNRPRECSAFTIGRILLDRMKVRAVSALAAALAATVEVAPKWG